MFRYDKTVVWTVWIFFPELVARYQDWEERIFAETHEGGILMLLGDFYYFGLSILCADSGPMNSEMYGDFLGEGSKSFSVVNLRKDWIY